MDNVAIEANETLEALLIFSRLNTEEKHFETASLEAAIGHADDQIKELYGDGLYTLSYDGFPTVEADKQLLERLFFYLFDNCVKFRKDDEPAQITVTGDANKTSLTCCVADNGTGLMPQKHDDALIILRKCHGSKYQGSGAGLSYAKKIIEMHGGRLWIESETDMGMKVFFTLPLAD